MGSCRKNRRYHARQYHQQRISGCLHAQEIALMLRISKRKAYELCKSTKEFKVIYIGRNVRVVKDSFDQWIVD